MKVRRWRRPQQIRKSAHGPRPSVLLAVALAATLTGTLIARRAPREEPLPPLPAFSGTEQEAEAFAAAMSDRVLPPQRRIERAVLDGIRSPCCGKHQMSGRCCGCLLSRAITGLARTLVLRGVTDVESVRRTVEGWIRAARRQGFSGKACVEQRCARPFTDDGCGGGMAHAGH